MPRLVLNTAIFTLIRTPNLFIVALVQVLLYEKLLLPAFRLQDIAPQLDIMRFALLVGVTLCITAGGYIINDIIDVPIDRINRPQKMIVGQRMAERTVYWFYFIFNLTGYTVALYLAFFVQKIALVGLFLLAVSGLFMYSLKLKRMPLIGNLAVAVYCAAAAGVVWFAERDAFYQLGTASPILQQALTEFLIWYLILAFLATLFRELVKDIEDQTGDKALGALTLPVWAGVRVAKTVAIACGAAIAAALVLMSFRVQSLFYTWSVPVFLAAVLLPLGFTLVHLSRAKEPADYRRLSLIAKWIILAGLLLPAFVHF